MTLRETLEKMKSETKSENFNIMVESMRRRARKGMIPNVSEKDIDQCLREMEEETAVPQSILEKEEMIALIADLENACNKYNYLTEDAEISDEDFNSIALHEFYSKANTILKETLKDRYEELKDKRAAWKEENPEEHAKQNLAIGAGVGAAAATPFVADISRRHTLRQNFIDNAFKNGSTASRAELASQFNKANPSMLKNIGGKIVSGAGKAASWLAARPLLGAGLVGAGAVAAGSLLALAIKRARQRRERMLREEDGKAILFNSEILKETQDILNTLPDSFIDILLAESNELVQELIFEAYEFENSENLNEAVSYIDNNGELKVTSTDYYVKHMSDYSVSTEMEKFDIKKRKNRTYKMINEDIDSFKKLSEMSLEDILSEVD